jgi:HSP20 family protein
MNTLTEQIRHGAEHAWASLSEGWHDLRARTSGALTRFRRSDRDADDEIASAFDRPGSVDWALMAADVRLEDDRVVVRVEAPGMSREDLHVDVDGDRLCVWGEKRLDHETREADFRPMQCAYGHFRREVALPRPVDADKATASYRDGVLRIQIPRLERGSARRIPVQGS